MGVLFDASPVEAALTSLLAYEYPAVDLTPTIRFSDPAARAVHTKYLQSLLNDISATRDTIEMLGEKLERLKYGLRRREVAVKTTLAPVTGLPSEVLREVFLAAAAQTPSSRTPLILSHVNSNWRSLSINTRELWTLIQVPSHCNGSEMFEEFALRSETLPLQIVRLGPPLGASHTAPLRINLLPIHASRISSIELHSTAESEQWISSLESCAATMALRDLVFSNQYSPEPALHCIHGGMASTRSLRLSGASLMIDKRHPLNRLEALSIFNVSCEEIGVIMEALRSVPSLTALELCHITAGEDIWTINDAASHDDSLTSLAIISCSVGLWKSLQLWSMPNLTSLTVVNDGRLVFAIHWANILSHSSNLEAINLTVSGAYAGPNLSLFFQFLSGEAGQQRNSLLFLRSLSIRAYDTDSMQGRDILDIVETRASPNSGATRLQCLNISECLVPPEREERLREFVDTLMIYYNDPAPRGLRAIAAKFMTSLAGPRI